MNNNVEKVDLDRVDWKSSREFFESLGDALDELDDKDESYNFTWVGKRKSIIEAGAPINKILRPDVEASKNFDNTKNMLIVGDNLDALKLLQESYLGKIKMIYIDPPYNTGHDFVYHDNFTVKKADFEDNSTDSDGNVIISEDEYTENSKANGRFHSDWLSMMYPRLRLARNLLTDDGVIFISIDDNEQANLKKLCDEIFGDDNFVATVTRVTKKGGNKGYYIKPKTDYILMYFKDLASINKNNYGIVINKNVDDYEWINDENGKEFIKGEVPYRAKLDSRPNQRYYMQCPDGSFIIPKGSVFPEKKEDGAMIEPLSNNDKCWTWSQKRYLEEKKNNRFYFYESSNSPFVDENGEKSKWSVVRKIYKDELEISSRNILSTLIEDADNAAATREVDSLDIPFQFPKSIRLIQFLIKNVDEENGIFLDFFSGSGTTGHAVMNLNAEDGGKRQYICVQLDEKTDEKSEAKKAGYDTIDQITAERLRRAGDKIMQEHPDADIDTGFRLLRIDSNNEKDGIRKPLSEIGKTDIFNSIDNIKKDRTPLDLLFGVVYVSALPFDLKLATRKIGENTVYLYGYLDEDTGLVACFDDNIPEETIKEIANLKALTAAFKDSSFTGSAAKINLSEHFRIISPDTKVKVI